MGVLAPQLLGLLVHQLHKIADAGVVGHAPLGNNIVPGGCHGLSVLLPRPRVLGVRRVRGHKLAAGILAVYILHQRHRRVVAGGYHQKVQKLISRKLLPYLHPRQRTARALKVVRYRLGHGYLRVFYVGYILIGDYIGHYLRHGGHGQGVVRVQGIHHRVRVYVQHEEGLAVGPAAVGLRRYEPAVVYLVPPVPVKGEALRHGGQGCQCSRQHGQNCRRQHADEFHLFIPPHLWYNVAKHIIHCPGPKEKQDFLNLPLILYRVPL